MHIQRKTFQVKLTDRIHQCPGDHRHVDKLTSNEVLAWHHSKPESGSLIR